MEGDRRSLPPWRSVLMITALPWAALISLTALYGLFSARPILGFLGLFIIIGLGVLALRAARRRAAERAYHPHLGPGGPIVHTDGDDV